MTVSCLTDDGLIDESDLREVMKACMVENGMQFDEKEVASLANALFEDAVQVAAVFFIFNFGFRFRFRSFFRYFGFFTKTESKIQSLFGGFFGFFDIFCSFLQFRRRFPGCSDGSNTQNSDPLLPFFATYRA